MARAALLAAIFTLGMAGPLRAQSDPLPYCAEKGVSWGLGPTLVPASDGRKLGVRGSLSGCLTGHVQPRTLEDGETQRGFPRSYAVALDVDMLWAGSSIRLPDANSVRASAGWSVSLSKRPTRAPRTWPIDSLDAWPGGGYNRGFVDLGGSVGYESSPDWDEQNFTLGGQVRYAINAARWARLLPSFVGSVDLVKPGASKVRADLGLSKDVYGRWSVRGYWNTSLDFIAEGLSSVRVEADLALYRTFGLDQALVNEGWNQGEYARAGLRYAKRHKILGRINLNSMYARYSAGQWPTASDEEDALALGIVIGVGG